MRNMILFCLLGVCLAGCTALNNISKGISQKSISGSGAACYTHVGLETQTQTPEIKTLFLFGDYASVVPGTELLRFEEYSEPSVFNNNAVSKRRKIFFASPDKKRMDKVISKITDCLISERNGDGGE
jgi:hypothetical protein